MELVHTDIHTANSILNAKTRVILAETKKGNYYKVLSINPNNDTLIVEISKSSRLMLNDEDVTLYIKVPARAKTVY